MGDHPGSVDCIHNALKLYYAKKGKYPDTSTGPRALVETQTLEQMPREPGGNEDVYLNEGGKPVITAYGADGAPGGEDADADVSSSDLKKDAMASR